MIFHDVVTLYTFKAIEYLIALAFLALFIPFWRYAQSELPARQPVHAAARPRLAALVEWFRVAPDAAYHPGHAWARVDRPGLVTVGISDFAQKLVGPVARLDLPPVGGTVGQGVRGWALQVDGKAVDMISPVDGLVAAVNPKVVESPELVNQDPYGEGWLFRVHAPRCEANMKGLLTGRLATRWIEEATDQLRRRMAPELGLALQDGGMPVDGIAQAIDPEHWDSLAREFFLS